jgi:two-component system NtrC family sensor kinase
MRLRVRHKLVLLCTAILVGVASGFLALSAILTGRWLDEEMRSRATAFARAIAATISTRAELENGEALEAQIRQIQAVRDDVVQLDILAIGPTRSDLVATTSPAARLAFTRAERAEVLRGRVVSHPLRRSAGDRWEVMVPIALDGAVVGALGASFSSVPAERLAARLRAGAALLSGAAVLAMGILVSVTVRAVVDRPVQEFMTAIARLEAGDASARVTAPTGDEFGTLARHFNDTLTRIQRFSEELQVRVSEATAELERRYRQVDQLNAMLFDLQRQLSRAERLALSGRIMAEVAHEVGTPLHSVAGHLELLRKDLPPHLVAGELGQRLDVIQGQVARVIEIIAQLLDLTRSAPGPAGPVDLNRVVQDVGDLVRPATTSAGLTLELALDPGLPRIQGHRHELQQLLLNLITNAIDATPAGGRVSITTAAPRSDGPVELAVTDSGRGIPEPLRKAVFEPFFTTKHGGRGTGLGLAIASQIVRSHGGRIELASQEGRGTTFRVLVPRDPGPA